jgi:hypothetical protein
MSLSQKIDVSLLPRNVPSLCIPRVFPNITKDRIFKSFKDIDIGFIDKIETIICTDKVGKKYQRVFVHLQWNNAPHAIQMRHRVLEGKDVKIVYDEPWFWKVSATNTQARERTRPQQERIRLQRPSNEKIWEEESDIEEQIRTKKAENDRQRNYIRPKPQMPKEFQYKKEEQEQKQKQNKIHILEASETSVFTKVERKK